MICKNTCIKKEDVYYHVICLQSNPLLLDSELVFQVQSGLKCTLLSIPPFHPVLPTSIFPLSDHISVSTYVQKCMQLVTKMADLTKFLQTEWILIWILWFWQTSVKFLKVKSDWWNWQFWKIFVKLVIAKSAWQIWRFWCIFVTTCISGHNLRFQCNENGRLNEISSNQVNTYGFYDFDEYQSNSSKQNQSGGIDNFDKILLNFS